MKSKKKYGIIYLVAGIIVLLQPQILQFVIGGALVAVGLMKLLDI